MGIGLVDISFACHAYDIPQLNNCFWPVRFTGSNTSIPRSAIQMSVITAGLQFLVNNVRVGRLSYLRGKAKEEGLVDGDSVAIPSVSHPNPSTTFNSPTTTNPVASVASTSTSTTEPFLTRVSDTLISYLPIRKLSDSEYIITLQKQEQSLIDELSAFDSKFTGKGTEVQAGWLGGKGQGAVEKELEGLRLKIREVEGRIDAERSV